MLVNTFKYTAFGEIRTWSGTNNTDYLYTGQRNEAETGLYFYKARFYDPALGRFIQPDTLVPDPVSSAAYDRYAYVNNNPINFNDPSGHCPLCVSAAIGAGVGAAVGAVGYGIYIAASGNEFNWGHLALATGGGLAAGALIGTGVGWAAGVSQASTTAATITGAGTFTVAKDICGSGLCASKASEISKIYQRTNQSVWRLNPLARGVMIENSLGRSAQLSPNFPIIDRFENGIATSIKSIDLSAKTYQNISALTTKVMGYGNKLLQWQGTNSQGWAGTVISNSMIESRRLLLAIPPNGTQEQIMALQRIQNSFANSNLLLQIAIIR